MTWDNSNDQAKVSAPAQRRLILSYLWPQRYGIALMGLLLIGSIGAEVAEPVVISFFIESVQSGDSWARLRDLIVLFFGVTACRHILRVSAAAMSERVAWSSTNALRADLAAHVLRLDLGFHESRSSGELIERIDGDVNQIAELFSTFIIQLAGNALLLLSILVALAVINPLISLSAVVAITLGMLALRKVQQVARVQWQADREQSALFYGNVSESLDAIEDIRSLNAMPYSMVRFYRRLRTWAPVRVRAEAWGSSIWVIATLIITATTAFAYGLGGTFYKSGGISLGQVYLIVTYISMITAPMEVIREQVHYLQQAVAATRRVNELMSITSRIQDGDRPLPDGALSVDFDRVTFGYATDSGSDRTVLGDLSFRLEKGRTLGLVGRTGAGKTTIAHLMFRMYDPDAGRVRLGGVDLSTARIDSLRGRVGFVTQDVHIFDATLRDNLTFFDPEISDARLTEILGKLGLTVWLESLPEGLASPISASALSAGQGQLIGLARVFIKDPGLVILDEPSSYLDPATEAVLETALDALIADRTAVLIAHRLSSIHRTDEVMVLESGRVVEHGPTEELLTDSASRLSELRRLGEALA